MSLRFEDVVPKRSWLNVERHTDQLAINRGDQEADKLRASLVDYVPDPLAETLLNEIAAKERNRAIAAFKELREKGGENDRGSTGLGYTALLLNLGPEMMEYLHDKSGYTTLVADMLPEIIDVEGEEGIYAPLVALRAPQGSFKVEEHHIGFSLISQQFGAIIQPTGRVRTIAKPNVATIIGDSGELWTSPRASLARVALHEAALSSF